MKGINAPLTQVIKPKIKKSPAIIAMATLLLGLFVIGCLIFVEPKKSSYSCPLLFHDNSNIVNFFQLLKKKHIL
jgi:hypothetical protein